MAVRIQRPPFISRPLEPPKPRPQPQSKPTQDFEALLKQLEPTSPKRVAFSAHAEARLRERNIQLSPAEVQQLGEAVSKVEQKGARESLILMGDLAFVVNVKQRNVITVLDGAHMRERVFTNIDSAIIIDDSNDSTGQALV